MKATERSGRNDGAYISLQMQIIGRRNIPLDFGFLPVLSASAFGFFDSFVWSFMNRSKNSIEAIGAPSISSG